MGVVEGQDKDSKRDGAADFYCLVARVSIDRDARGEAADWVSSRAQLQSRHRYLPCNKNARKFSFLLLSPTMPSARNYYRVDEGAAQGEKSREIISLTNQHALSFPFLTNVFDISINTAKIPVLSRTANSTCNLGDS